MAWKFWSKKMPAGSGAPSATKKEKLPGPKELPQQVGRYLVVILKKDPDWTWSLRCVSRPREEKRHTFHFRVFSPSQASEAGAVIRNWDSLDAHPELILYDGWYDKSSNEAVVHPK